MWLRLGRRSSHPTLLVQPDSEIGPHGPEGDIDNVGAGGRLKQRAEIPNPKFEIPKQGSG